MSDAIYGRVRGAVYDTTNEWWLVPCGQYLNVSFNFGGRNYPIHPLDLVDNNFKKTDATGKPVCIGSVCFMRGIHCSGWLSYSFSFNQSHPHSVCWDIMT